MKVGDVVETSFGHQYGEVWEISTTYDEVVTGVIVVQLEGSDMLSYHLRQYCRVVTDERELALYWARRALDL